LITNSNIGVQGRLGNQLFQYAFLFAQARRLGTTAFVNRELHGYRLRRYQLDCSGTIEHVSQREYRRLLARHIVATVEEPSLRFEPTLLTAPDACDYHGYFQSELYFAEFADDVRPLFALQSTDAAGDWPQRIAACPTDVVAVHVRRGDYLKNPAVFANIFTTDYYARADQLMSTLLGRPYLLLVFSDDIPWCMANPLFPAERQVVYVSGNDASTDIYLQSLCNHHIIANSSFSWWGAWLATGEGQQVIAPATWFGPRGQQQFDAIYCPGWHVV
jgi:hypothetical protein